MGYIRRYKWHRVEHNKKVKKAIAVWAHGQFKLVMHTQDSSVQPRELAAQGQEAIRLAFKLLYLLFNASILEELPGSFGQPLFYPKHSDLPWYSSTNLLLYTFSFPVHFIPSYCNVNFFSMLPDFFLFLIKTKTKWERMLLVLMKKKKKRQMRLFLCFNENIEMVSWVI